MIDLIKGGVVDFLFGISIFEILVFRNTPSIGGTFGEIFRPPCQTGYMPRPCPNMARKFGIFLIYSKGSHDGTQSKALGLLSAAI